MRESRQAIVQADRTSFRPPAADVPRSYDADTITSFEAGLKTDIGRRVSIDLSAYHLRWKDIQLFTVIDNFGLNANGGKAPATAWKRLSRCGPFKARRSANGAFIDAQLTRHAAVRRRFQGRSVALRAQAQRRA